MDKKELEELNITEFDLVAVRKKFKDQVDKLAGCFRLLNDSDNLYYMLTKSPSSYMGNPNSIKNIIEIEIIRKNFWSQNDS